MTLLESIDRVDATVPKADPRELTFLCGKPAVQQPAPQPAAQPVVKQDVQPVAPQRQMVLQGDANFATDSSTLSPTAKASLDRFLSANQGIQLRRVIVTGYTDSTASEAHNLELSRARATTVAQYLRDGGLQAEQFYTQGKGSADPVASNATAEGRAQNRRVEASVRVE
ncbi:OmpA family protein [Paraburkholderia bryophila]|uniref:OmpA family protein n=1 Tax=Paraburkholderia bryophila TaxID=420952 RepID=UPI0030B811F0